LFGKQIGIFSAWLFGPYFICRFIKKRLYKTPANGLWGFVKTPPQNNFAS
jgi:hypothetical protein